MNPYKYADAADVVLRKYIGAEFQNASVLMPFDEINLPGVKDTVDALYKRMDAKCRKEFLKIAKAAYKDACEQAGKKPLSLVDMAFVTALLAGYDPVTQVVYKAEWTRKRDRAIEGIVSSHNRLALRKSLRTSRSLLTRQVEWYTDIVTDEATEKAYRDSGVKRVKWVTEKDDRVCDVCRERDGNIYPIDEVPVKPHRGCRCYLRPVK